MFVNGCQSRVKYEEKNCRERRSIKKPRVQKSKLRFHVESAKVEQGCFKADSMAALYFGYCERDFFFYGLLFLLTEPKFHLRPTLSSNNSRSET